MQIKLKERFEFTFLDDYDEVFKVFDEQDSGCISFGVIKDGIKYFLKFAGAKTINYNGAVETAISLLKASAETYEALSHPLLVKILDHYEVCEGYLLVFEWFEGESLHAHWQFDEIPKYTHPDSPNYKIRRLEDEVKYDLIEQIMIFYKFVIDEGYIPVDFYDGSIMYNFEKHHACICDIDVYHKGAFCNDMGRMWGSSRFMSPEEFELGAVIDEKTTVFTMGALAFEILGNNRHRDIKFWQGNKALYDVAYRATQADRELRYDKVESLLLAWQSGREEY